MAHVSGTVWQIVLQCLDLLVVLTSGSLLHESGPGAHGSKGTWPIQAYNGIQYFRLHLPFHRIQSIDLSVPRSLAKRI